MQIFVKTKKDKGELENYIDYVHKFRVKIKKIAKGDSISMSIPKGGANTIVDISKRRSVKLDIPKINFTVSVKRNIPCDCLIVCDDVKSTNQIYRFLDIIREVFFKMSLSDKSEIVVDGKSICNIDAHMIPIRSEWDRGFELLSICGIKSLK